jgi:hypothetical protein
LQLQLPQWRNIAEAAAGSTAAEAAVGSMAAEAVGSVAAEVADFRAVAVGCVPAAWAAECAQVLSAAVSAEVR